jgi:hypothetical protein
MGKVVTYSLSSFSGGSDTSLVYDEELDQDVMEFNCMSEKVRTPAVKFQKTDFTIEMWFKSTLNGERQILFGDWVQPWQFHIGVTADDMIEVVLRRDINSSGSDPSHNLLVLTGGTVKREAWQHLVVTYANGPGTCDIYIDGAKVASATTEYPDHNLQDNDHMFYTVGFKEDSSNECFNGQIGLLRITNKLYHQGDSGNSGKVLLHIRGLPRVSTPHDAPREHALFASIDLY